MIPSCGVPSPEFENVNRAAIGHLNSDDRHDLAIVENNCDEVHLLIADGTNQTLNRLDSLGSPMILPLFAKLGSSQNEILIDDLDGDGADDILVVRTSADGRLSFAEYIQNLN